MHKQILSEKERTIIKHFLESDEKLEGFRMLKLRIKNYESQITQDYTLIKKFLSHIHKEP